MDGVHDMGGTDGFEPVTPTEEPYFTADWERTAFALMPSLVGQGVANMHEFRHGVERMGAVSYLATPYYEHWLASFERLLIEKEVVSASAVERRIRTALDGDEALSVEGGDPDAEAVQDLIHDGVDRGQDPADPAFEPGDQVRVMNVHPEGHTRCPDYLRRARGTVDAVHDAYLVPDANAHGREEIEPVYSVRFDPAELWGSAAERNEAVYADLWERYLRGETE